MDLGSTNSDVHPARKTEVGQRLAYVAAAKIYGKDVEYSGPQVASAKPAGNVMKVTFKHDKGLSTTNGNAPTGFEIAGSNGKFEDATATLKGDTVELTAPGVKKPVKVRYGWKVYFEPNLVNEAKLPAVPYAGADSKKGKTGKK